MRELPDKYTGTDANSDMVDAGAVDNPLPRSKEVEYADHPRLWAAGVFEHKPTFKDVKVAEVKTSQDYLIPSRVQEYMLPDEERPDDTRKLTSVIRVGDEIVTVDGTHRLAAYWLQNEVEIHVQDFGRWHKNADGDWKKRTALPVVQLLPEIREQEALAQSLGQALKEAQNGTETQQAD